MGQSRTLAHLCIATFFRSALPNLGLLTEGGSGMHKSDFCVYRTNWTIFKGLWAMHLIALKVLVIFVHLALLTG